MTVRVELEERQFRDFAVFDMMHRQGRWRAPVIFMGIFIALAVLCIIFRARLEQAALLATVLLISGIALPLVYFFIFYRSIIYQCKKMELPRFVYEIGFEPDGGVLIKYAKGGGNRFSLANIHRVYRRSDAIYLYISAEKAFILPGEAIQGGTQALWDLLHEQMPSHLLVESPVATNKRGHS